MSSPPPNAKRICQIIKLKPSHVSEYKKIHSPGSVWPSVLAALARHRITDYSIHYYAPLNLLVAHMKYIGPEDEYERDMQGIAEDEETQRWWAMTDGMQESFQEGAVGSKDAAGGGVGWWTELEEVFRFEGAESSSEAT